MIYLCGDIYGNSILTESEFVNAERALTVKGYDVRSGREAFNYGRSRSKIMRESLKILCDCDGVAMLQSVKKSRQAGFEIKAAFEMEIPVMPLKWWLNEL